MFRFLCRICGLAIAGIWLAGCASGPDFYAEDLPTELHAPPATNAQTINWSRLAVSTSTSDTIEPGDVLEVTIAANLSLQDMVTLPVRVNEKGIAALPVIGEVPLGGLRLEDAESAIAATSMQAQLYRAPQVTVSMKRKHTNRITVVGAVEKPGLYNLPSGHSNLLAAVVAAGGLTKEAGTIVEIRDPQPGLQLPPPQPLIASESEGDRVTPVSGTTGHTLVEMSATSRFRAVKIDLISFDEADSGLKLGDGAVVTVERRDPQPLDVLGLVRKPGRYEFPPNKEMRVLDAIAMAEGTSSIVADRIYVIRKTNWQEPVLIEVSLKAAKKSGVENIRLAPGDVVSVEQTPATMVLDTIRLFNFGVGASVL